MKKLIVLLIAGMLILQGCSSTKAAKKTTASTKIKETTTIATRTKSENVVNTFSVDFENSQFFSVKNVIYKFSITKNTFEKYAQIDTKQQDLDYVVTEDFIFYKETTGSDNEGFATGKVYRVKSDGSNKKEIHSHYALNLKVYNDRLYFSSNQDKKLISIDFDGNNKIVYNGTQSEVFDTISDYCFGKKFIYFSTPSGEVFKVDYKGKNLTDLNLKVDASGTLIIYKNKLFNFNGMSNFFIFDIADDSFETINNEFNQSKKAFIYNDEIYHIFNNKIIKTDIYGNKQKQIKLNISNNINFENNTAYHFILNNKVYFTTTNILHTIDLTSGQINEICKY